MADVIKGLVGSFGASLCFALLFHTPKRCLFWASMCAMIGYGCYMLTMALFSSPVGANFAAAFVIAVLAEVLARLQKAPASIYATVGILPIVPGAGLYRTMLALVLGDWNEAVQIGVQTVLIAGVIALAIAVVAVFTKSLKARGDR